MAELTISSALPGVSRTVAGTRLGDSAFNSSSRSHAASDPTTATTMIMPVARITAWRRRPFRKRFSITISKLLCESAAGRGSESKVDGHDPLRQLRQRRLLPDAMVPAAATAEEERLRLQTAVVRPGIQVSPSQ